MQAQAKYLEAVEKFGSMKDRVEGLLSSREDAYLGLLAVPDQGTPSHGSIHGAPVATLLHLRVPAAHKHTLIPIKVTRTARTGNR